MKRFLLIFEFLFFFAEELGDQNPEVSAANYHIVRLASPRTHRRKIGRPAIVVSGSSNFAHAQVIDEAGKIVGEYGCSILLEIVFQDPGPGGFCDEQEIFLLRENDAVCKVEAICKDLQVSHFIILHKQTSRGIHCDDLLHPLSPLEQLRARREIDHFPIIANRKAICKVDPPAVDQGPKIFSLGIEFQEPQVCIANQQMPVHRVELCFIERRKLIEIFLKERILASGKKSNKHLLKAYKEIYRSSTKKMDITIRKNGDSFEIKAKNFLQDSASVNEYENSMPMIADVETNSYLFTVQEKTLLIEEYEPEQKKKSSTEEAVG